jgi:membrane fusion protein (multidrug efflux system)
MAKKKWFFIIGGAGLFLVIVILKVVGSSSSGDSRRQGTALVTVEPVRSETVLYDLKFNGDVLPIQQAAIYSKVGGNLEKVFVDIGSRVQQNDLLAMIDTTELSQQFQQMTATYQNALSNFERTKELSEQNLVAKQDLDNAEAAMKVAKANFETARTKLDYARITAPFSGYITKRFLDPGALVNANNSTLFTLMDLEAMKIIINVLEKDISRVTVGRKATVTVDAFPGKEFYGTVARLSQAVDLSTRTMAVEVDMPNKDHSLKPGMFASVTLVVEEHKDAKTVPTQAILKDGNGSFVYSVNGRLARRVNVTLGKDQNLRTEILSGLTGKETIIVAGQQFVSDSSQVIVQ